MATIKISDLTSISPLNSNTSNVVFVGTDLQSGVTGKFTATTLAAGLYSHNILNVGNNAITLPNTVAQFALSGESYVQINFVNTNDGGTADQVITANSGTDSTYFIDMGYANKDYQPGSEFNNIGTAVNKLDGYIYAQGSTSNTMGGNLIVGSTTTGKEVRFVAGGGSLSNVVAKMSDSTITFNRPVTFADGTTQNTSFAGAITAANTAVNTATAYAQSAGSYANAAFAQANVGTAYATTAGNYANSAFTKANNALANTSGTFSGNLTITGNTYMNAVNTGNLTVVGTTSASGTVSLSGLINVLGAINGNATMVLANVNFNSTESALTIAASPTVITPSNDGYMIHISGKNGVPSRVVTDSYGANAYSLFAGRAARGTVTSPTALQSGDIIARFSANGYGTTKYQPLGTTRIDFIATENYTDANTGSQIKFWNCPVGSNTLTNIMSLNGNMAEFSGFVSPQKGFIYTPRIPSGNQTTITIDYLTDSMIKANLVADLTVSHSNFLAGKVVEVWLVNQGGTGRTVTHGISALNSTTNSTTFTIPATSAAHLRFFSIDGDLANTFVSVISA